MTLVEFLTARLEDDLQPCEGTGEYRDCYEFSERRRLEVEAKREIVKHHQPDASPTDGWYGNDAKCKGCGSIWNWSTRAQRLDPAHGGCPTLRLLALPYADHPEYREEWRQ